MKKELFHILQELKIDINSLELDYLKDKIDVLNEECMQEEGNFNYYNKKYFLNNIRILLFRIIMLDKCMKRKFDNYLYIKKILELKLDVIEEKYNNLLTNLILTELLLEKNINKESFLKNNFKQIDTFLELIHKLPKDETDKIFSYKMGVNNG